MKDSRKKGAYEFLNRTPFFSFKWKGKNARRWTQLHTNLKLFFCLWTSHSDTYKCSVLCEKWDENRWLTHSGISRFVMCDVMRQHSMRIDDNTFLYQHLNRICDAASINYLSMLNVLPCNLCVTPNSFRSIYCK